MSSKLESFCLRRLTISPIRIITKHLKRQIISLEGGFKVIADINAYHAFIAGLKQPSVTVLFDGLKMLGNIYIIDSPKELGTIVRDANMFSGTLSPEDLYEFLQVSGGSQESGAGDSALTRTALLLRLDAILRASRAALIKSCTASRSARTASSRDPPFLASSLLKQQLATSFLARRASSTSSRATRSEGPPETLSERHVIHCASARCLHAIEVVHVARPSRLSISQTLQTEGSMLHWTPSSNMRARHTRARTSPCKWSPELEPGAAIRQSARHLTVQIL